MVLCLVELEVGNEAKKACWIDGYVPQRSFLEKLFVESNRAADKAVLEELVERYSDDELFVQTLDRLASARYSLERRGRRRLVDFDDFFILCGMAPRFGSLAPSDFSPLYADVFSGMKGGRYRQVVSVYPCDSASGHSETRRLLLECGFAPRAPDSYRHIGGFRAAVRAVLLDVLEPYAAPAAAAERSLRDYGFQTMSFTS
jgi:hypothetical protein